MAREKTRKLVITFHTTDQAMRMEQYAREAKAPGRLIPVPRQISSGCGMAWCVEAEEGEMIKALIQERQINAEGMEELYL